MTQLTPPPRRCGRRATSAVHHLVVWTLLTTAAALMMTDDVGVTCAPTPQTPILRTTMARPPPLSTAAPNASAAMDAAVATTTARDETTDLIAEANVSTATGPATTGGPTATTDDALTADIADLFVANQDFGAIAALEAEAEGTAADALGTLSTVTASNDHHTDRPTTGADSSTSDESGDDDALFDVIIDGTAAGNTSAETATSPGAHDRLLEVDSEEFFVPADIKERETTTASTVTTSRPTEVQSTTTVGSSSSSAPATTAGSFERNRDTDTDADTIFYISNTEVKVSESAAGGPPPSPDHAVTTSAHPAQQQPDEELQFFPASYEEDVIIDVRRQNSSAWRIGTGRAGPDRYEEDLIISHPGQAHGARGPPPALNGRNGPAGPAGSTNDENLSISYVGESYIEVKEFSRDLFATGAPDRDEGGVAAAAAGAAGTGLNYAEYVIIEPIAETPGVTSTTGGPLAIGVPVIEELPPALIRQYTLSSSAASSAEDDQDVANEIVPVMREKTAQHTPAGIIGSIVQVGSADRTAAVEHRTDGAAAPLSEHTSGGATAMLHDWLSGVFGKNVPSKRNNHVGGTAGAGGASSSTATVVTGHNRTVAAAAAADVNGTLEVSAAVAVSVLNATGAGVSESRTEKSDESIWEMNSFYYWSSPILLLTCSLISCLTLAYYIRNHQMPGYYTFLSWLNLDTVPKDRNNDTSASSVITVVANQIEISPDSVHRPNDSIDFTSGRHGSMLSDQQFELHALNPSAQLHAPAPAPVVRSASVVPATSLIESSASLSSSSTVGGPNGSLITMTMKNNQLIVETEERNDIARNARETKVHYNSPSDPEAVFVVEVSRGADSVDAPNNYADQPPPEQQAPPLLPSLQTVAERPTTTQPEPLQQRDDAALLHNEEVQVHQPPAETGDSTVGVATTDTVAAAGMQKINTGLSQSDLSDASSGGSTRGYSYGEQAAYAVEAPGYQATVNNAQAVAVPPEPLPPKSPAPGATSAIAIAAVSPINCKPPPKADIELKAANDLNRSVKPQTNGEIGAVNKMQPAVLTNGNGCNGAPEDGACNGAGGAGCGAFDSLMNLPDPPSMDEIKLLNEFAMADNNNMDSLPPPPLELMDGSLAGVN